jgi:ribosomal protein L11 methyltransferase
LNVTVSWQSVSWVMHGKDVETLSEALLAAGAIAIDVSDADADTAAERPAFAEPGSQIEPWRRSKVTALFALDTDVGSALARACHAAGVEHPRELERAELPERDWVRLTQAQFKPIRISARLWIVPSWERAPDPAAINITLDPGIAFGTGSHATTRLCLRWLDANIRGGESVLDYGCGSGILAIAAARLGATRVSGVDIDPQAILAARANAMQNRIVAAFHEPGRNAPPACDVVLANILAGPLITLAPLLASATRPAGRIVLSGVLESQAAEVVAAYAAQFEMSAPVGDEDWVMLVGQRRR